MSAGTESPGQEDVQVIQAAYQLTIERSDPQRTAHSIERFLALLSESVVYVPEGGGAAPYRGRTAMRRRLARATEQWTSVRYQVEEILDLGDGELLVCGKVFACSDERRDLREIPFTNRWTLQAGRAVKVASFADRRQALEKG